MKKSLAVLVVLSILFTCLAGMAQAAPVTLQIANYAVLEAGYEPFWTSIKDGFEAANPDIKIEWVTAPYGEIVNQVINMAGGGTKVDMLFGEIGWVSGMEDAGLAYPIGDILSAGYIADFYSSILESFMIDGKAYALPLYVSPYVLYYNKDIFAKAGLDPEAPPATYDEMLAAAEKIAPLTTADGNKIYAFGQTTASVPVSGSSLTAMIMNFGGHVVSDDGALALDEGFTQAIEMLKLLNDKGYNPQNAKLKDLRNLFALGQLAMYYDQSWGFNGIKSINPDAASFTASAKPLKGGSGSGQSLLQSHCMIFTNNDPAKKDATEKFMQYLVSTDNLGDYLATITPAYPACKSMESVTLNPVLAGAAGSGENVMAMPLLPRLSDLNLELCTLAQAVTVSGTDVPSAIAEFQAAAESILAE